MASVHVKAEHVRQRIREGRAGNHHCHWHGCPQQVPPAIRNEIWRAYRIGQEDSKTPSAAYIAAARKAQEWIKANGKRSAET